MSRTKRTIIEDSCRKIKVMSELKRVNSFYDDVKDVYDLVACNIHSNRIKNRKTELENEFYKFPSAIHENWKYWNRFILRGNYES